VTLFFELARFAECSFIAASAAAARALLCTGRACHEKDNELILSFLENRDTKRYL